MQGETSTGTDLDEDFTFTQYTGLPALYSSFEDDITDEDFYSFTITRSDIKQGSSIVLSFTLEELSSTEAISANISFFLKKETATEIVGFDMNSSGNDTEITNISFDEETGRLKGTFELTGDNNSSEKDATVTGEFDVIVKKAIE